MRLGGEDLDDNEAEMIRIQNIIVHPEYSSQLHYNDIAVVKLQKGSRYIFNKKCKICQIIYN